MADPIAPPPDHWGQLLTWSNAIIASVSTALGGVFVAILTKRGDKATAEVTTAPNVQQVWSQSTIDLIEQYKDALERADRRQDDLEKRLDNVMEELGEVRRGNAAILQHIATLEGIIRKLGVEPPERPIVSRAKKHPPETAHEAKA
jgi:esterase/lipase